MTETDKNFIKEVKRRHKVAKKALEKEVGPLTKDQLNYIKKDAEAIVTQYKKLYAIESVK